jgi:hypothetical protein
MAFTADDLWNQNRVTLEEAEALQTAGGGAAKGLGRLGSMKGLGTSVLAGLILSKLMGLPGEIGNRRLRKQALRQQAADVTPERLYYEASLPQAQAEEDMARQALFAQLSGGVLGPSLARGERKIGG